MYWLPIIALLATLAPSYVWTLNHVLLASSTIQLNQADIALTTSVTAGAFAAIEECKYQFENDLWSCPRESFKLDPQISSSFLNDSSTSSVVINSSNNSPRKRRKISGPPPQIRVSNRETAFVHAITAAGITHTLTRNCSRGDFADCVCDTRPRAPAPSSPELEWEMRGCSDNYNFGAQVAQQFLDARENGLDSASLANLHNNEAGRVAVKKTMRRLCKCHGVSGSCATQTCWRQISDFREVGNHLKKMYRQALRINLKDDLDLDLDVTSGILERDDNSITNRIARSNSNFNNNQNLSPRKPRNANNKRKQKNRKGSRNNRRNNINRRRGRMNRNNRKSKRSYNSKVSIKINSQKQSNANVRDDSDFTEEMIKKLKKRKLVFLEDSPDYCRRNKTAGNPGMVGRKVTSEPGSSKSQRTQFKNFRKMCSTCGLKIKRKVLDVWTSCNCRFLWCCQVECETCRKKKVELTCVPGPSSKGKKF